MLENIFQIIDKKVEEEIKRIIKEKERVLLDLEKKHKEEYEQRKKTEKETFEKKIKEEIKEFKQKQELEVNFHVQRERNEVMKKVYEEVKEGLSSLPNEHFENLIKKMLSHIPQGLDGKIVAGRKTADVLRKILTRSDLVIKNDLKEEGFIFKSSALEIDVRFSQILVQLREKIDPEIIKILFK